MVTITEIRQLKEHVQREMPEALRASVPPPTWTGSPEEWQELVSAARECWRLQPLLDFALAVAERGYYPDELTTGELRPGAQINAATGEVVRPPKPTISRETEDQARRALRALADRGLSIDTILQVKLEHVAWGRYTSDPKGAETVIKVAESAINAFDAERRAAQAEADARPILTVEIPFRAKGKSYPVGTYAVGPEVAAELQDWQAKMEGDAEQHGWDAPMGYCPENWPLFVLEDS